MKPSSRLLDGTDELREAVGLGKVAHAGRNGGELRLSKTRDDQDTRLRLGAGHFGGDIQARHALGHANVCNHNLVLRLASKLCNGFHAVAR